MTTLNEFLKEWHSDSERMLVHTSGSTGTPKPLWVEKRRMTASARTTCRFLGLKPGDTALLCMSLDYIAGMMMAVRAEVCGLHLVEVTPSGHPLADLESAPTFAAMVPMQVFNSMQVPAEREILKQIKHLIIGGGAIDDDLAAELKGFPYAIWSTYGMTETLSHIALRRLNGPEASEWYTPLDGVSVGLSPDGCLTINAPEVCASTLVTNDIADIDSDGRHFRIHGRKDNVICSGGIKIQAEEVERIVASGGKRPHLAAVLVGHDGGSETYVRNKVKACEECGFTSSLIRYEADVTEDELLACVDRLNRDADVDGFHPVNVGRMAIGLPAYVSATPKGIYELLRRYGIATSGQKCVILGRSNIVGKPMAQLMMQKQYGDATVTVCHSHSLTLKEECRAADILIAAIGQPGFVTADMVKEGAVVIDVGTTRVPDPTRKSGYRLCGDVRFDEVSPKCSFITPVPGGVGPMTIVSLMKNTLLAGKKAIYE